MGFKKKICNLLNYFSVSDVFSRYRRPNELKQALAFRKVSHFFCCIMYKLFPSHGCMVEITLRF